MSKPLIVIADIDEQYIMTLESKIIKELDGQVELEVITNPSYFNQFFSTPKTAEVVVVTQDLYHSSLKKHNINHIFVLTDQINDDNTAELNIEPIYKYSAINEIYNQLIFQSREQLHKDVAEKMEPVVIAFYSACGGTGKTTLSMALAKCLTERFHTVLYVNTESVQSFGHYLQDNTICLPNDGYQSVRNDLNHVYSVLKPYIRQEGFSYIPPMTTSLDAVNLKPSLFVNLIQEAKKSHEYDYIIVDVEAGYNDTKMELLQCADKIMLVVTQDTITIQKYKFLNKNIDLSDRERCVYVCNKADDSVTDEMEQWFSNIQMHERVEIMEQSDVSLDLISQTNGMKAVSYLFD